MESLHWGTLGELGKIYSMRKTRGIDVKARGAVGITFHTNTIIWQKYKKHTNDIWT